MARGSSIGERVHVIGHSCSGKSTLGQRLAGALDVPFVELDALNWLPGWVGLNATNPAELERRMREATSSDAWMVAGSYTDFSQRVFWSRVQTVVWLDLPLQLLLARFFRRSWKRSHSRELLWGTNYEKFWPHLLVHRKERSLLWWIVTQHARRRRGMLAAMTDPRWSHVRFVRLTSAREVESFARALASRSSQSLV